jgi:hypothetical protein
MGERVQVLEMSPNDLVVTLMNGLTVLGDHIKELTGEIQVLTQERDNALLRIEELEGQIEYWRNYRPWSEPGVADYYRGGVNPNA